MSYLLAYSSIIVKASHVFEGSPWIDYDVHFRRQVATQSNPKWATIDAALWTMYFTRATPKPAPTGPTDDRKQPSQDRWQQGQSKYSYTPYPTNRVCFRLNSRAGCHLVDCKFLHCCLRCRDTSYTARDCPQGKPNTIAPHSQDQPPTGTNFRRQGDAELPDTLAHITPQDSCNSHFISTNTNESTDIMCIESESTCKSN